tara:strand:- start:182 stop:1123 length:942 start_codon:yes stop_codon:yes gene_type:complete
MEDEFYEEKGYYFNLSKHLEEFDISDNEILRKAGITRRTLNGIKEGKRPIPKKTLRKVFNAIHQRSVDLSRSSQMNFFFEPEYTDENQLNLDLSGETKYPAIEGITPVELAILALTNPKDWANSSEEHPFRILTSTDVYYYVPVIMDMLSYDGEEADEAFGDKLEYLTSQLREAFLDSFVTKVPILEVKDNALNVDSRVFRALNLDQGIEDFAKVKSTLKSLCDRGLIVDPLVETVGVVGISVFGLVPTSFTKRTTEGDIVYRKISAILWEYEYLSEGEKIETKLHFRANAIVDNLKKVIYSVNKTLNGAEKN